MPPYTTSSAGRSATSGSRLFMSIRSAASVCHERHERVEPCGARTTRDGSLRIMGELPSVPGGSHRLYSAAPAGEPGASAPEGWERRVHHKGTKSDEVTQRNRK